VANLDASLAPLHVTTVQGKTWDVLFTCRDDTGTLLNLTGYSAAWALAPYAGGSAVATAGTADHIAMGGTAGTIHLVYPGTATAAIPAGDYVWEVELTSSGGVKPPFVGGRWTVKPEVVL